MSFDFNNETPIYLQIIEHLKKLIISKKLLPNQKLMTVREMSLEYGVNPNTIQKALKELEDIGLIYTESTNGKFVTNNEEVINRVRDETIKQMVDNFFESMEQLGINKCQTINFIKGDK